MYFKPADMSLNGIFTYIYHNYRANLGSILSFSSSEIFKNRASAVSLFDPDNYGNKNSDNFHTISVPNSFVQVSFKSKEVILSHYTLVSRNDEYTQFLIRWKLEASNDKRRWHELHVQPNTTALIKLNATYTCQCTKLGAFKHFKLTNTGGTSYSDNEYYLVLHRMEFFGEISDAKACSCKLHSSFNHCNTIFCLIIITR